MPRLSLQGDRDPALAATTALVRQVWTQFDAARDAEPELGPDIRALLSAGLPEGPAPVSTILTDAAAVLDRSLAQSRPRYLAYIGSSGLEVGAIADFLAASYDINMAVDARAASLLERQASRWLAEFIGYPHGRGLFTSGGSAKRSSATAGYSSRQRSSTGGSGSGPASPTSAPVQRTSLSCSRSSPS